MLVVHVKVSFYMLVWNFSVSFVTFSLVCHWIWSFYTTEYFVMDKQQANALEPSKKQLLKSHFFMWITQSKTHSLWRRRQQFALKTELWSLLPSEFMRLECNAEGILSTQSPSHVIVLGIKYCIPTIRRTNKIITLKSPRESKWVLPGSTPCSEVGGSTGLQSQRSWWL